MCCAGVLCACGSLHNQGNMLITYKNLMLTYIFNQHYHFFLHHTIKCTYKHAHTYVHAPTYTSTHPHIHTMLNALYQKTGGHGLDTEISRHLKGK